MPPRSLTSSRAMSVPVKPSLPPKAMFPVTGKMVPMRTSSALAGPTARRNPTVSRIARWTAARIMTRVLLPSGPTVCAPRRRFPLRCWRGDRRKIQSTNQRTERCHVAVAERAPALELAIDPSAELVEHLQRLTRRRGVSGRCHIRDRRQLHVEARREVQAITLGLRPRLDQLLLD